MFWYSYIHIPEISNCFFVFSDLSTDLNDWTWICWQNFLLKVKGAHLYSTARSTHRYLSAECFTSMWHIGKFRFFSGFQVNWCFIGIRSMWPIWPTPHFIGFIHKHNTTYGTSMYRVHSWTFRKLNATFSASRWPIWSIEGKIRSQ